jgi:Mn2+/Fe2+ NRAMP family transporter
MLWTMPFIYPFMTAIQEISARMGRVTGRGISANLRQCYPRWLLYLLLGLLLFASPYLFFWQSSQEVEELKGEPQQKALNRAPKQGPENLRRIRWDTYIGMAFSNLIAYFIILTVAVTLNAHGKTDKPAGAKTQVRSSGFARCAGRPEG